MARITLQDLADSFRQRSRSGQVAQVVEHAAGFHGIPNAVYIYVRRPSFANMALMTHTSGNCEVALLQINQYYLLQVGRQPYACIQLRYPPRVDGDVIQSMNWIAHTHPGGRLPPQMTSTYGPRMSLTPTAEDRQALQELNRVCGQTSSILLICVNGAVTRRTTFSVAGPDVVETP